MQKQEESERGMSRDSPLRKGKKKERERKSEERGRGTAVTW
jgi:hypothetical protein